jgi:hypothetical protein
MKAILGSLLCVVLFASACFALSDGLPYPGSFNVVGIYAGVLQPAFDPTDPFSANFVRRCRNDAGRGDRES